MNRHEQNGDMAGVITRMGGVGGATSCCGYRKQRSCFETGTIKHSWTVSIVIGHNGYSADRSAALSPSASCVLVKRYGVGVGVTHRR